MDALTQNNVWCPLLWAQLIRNNKETNPFLLQVFFLIWFVFMALAVFTIVHHVIAAVVILNRNANPQFQNYDSKTFKYWKRNTSYCTERGVLSFARF